MGQDDPRPPVSPGGELRGREPSGRVGRGLLGIIVVMNALGSLWIAVLMILINADVIAREALTAPIRGVSEIVALSIVGIVFLQIAHTLWSGRITRSDSLIDRLVRTRPAIGHGLDAVFNLAGTAVMAILCWASWPYFLRAFEEAEYVGALGDFTAPTWPVRLIILVGSGVTSLTFLVLAFHAARQAWRPVSP